MGGLFKHGKIARTVRELEPEKPRTEVKYYPAPVAPAPVSQSPQRTESTTKATTKKKRPTRQSPTGTILVDDENNY